MQVWKINENVNGFKENNYSLQELQKILNAFDRIASKQKSYDIGLDTFTKEEKPEKNVVTNEDNSKTQTNYSYDSRGKLSSTTEILYSAEGTVLKETRLSYCAGNLTRTIQKVGNKVTTKSYSNGILTQSIEREGSDTTTKRYSNGVLTNVIVNCNGEITNTQYSFGKALSITKQNNSASTKIEFEADGHTIAKKTTIDGNKTIRRTYERGVLRKTITQNGSKLTVNNYDNSGKLQNTTIQDGDKIISFDASGRLINTP